MKKHKIAVIVGSLRKESFSLKTAKALIRLAPESLSLEIINIANLPMFNEDLEATPPNEWVEFREQITAADGLLFVTPEYNRSVPGVLVNAIDVGSRPYGQNSWDGKPGAVVSVSIGNISGFGANHHLRQSLTFVNVPTMAQPEAYIGGATALFDDEGKLTNDSTREFLKSFMEAFEKWVRTMRSNGNSKKMKNSAKAVVEKMFAAFDSGDVEEFVATVSDNTVWVYHGTQIIPKGTFEKKEGVRAFFSNILDKTEIINFEPLQYIVEGNMVVVIGQEHQRVKRSGRELKQKWVQIYTVENNLITRMEEFATSEEVK